MKELKGAKKLEIADKSVFDSYFNKFPSQISELTFTNLFIWRDYYDFFFKEFNDHLIIFSKEYLNKWKPPVSGNDNYLFFFPPIGDTPEDIILELFKKDSKIEFHRISELLLNRIEKKNTFNSSEIAYKEDRNNWDYVYEKEKLINLPGNSLRQKRRNLTKFFNLYEYDFIIINDKLLELCKNLQIEWCDMNECQSNEDLQEEQRAIFNAFDYFNELNYVGGMILVNNKCIAYTLGEKLNSDTLVIHIEKAHMDYEGSYQAINNLFIKNCCQDVEYINREQDLGIAGLRNSKESYKPIHMVKKFILYKS